jgi:hypothetical protein
MSENESRIGATFFIWLAFTVVSITAMLRDIPVQSGSSVFLAILLVLGAVSATRYVWRGSEMTSRETAEKMKRRSRVERMIDRMSEQDIEELRARLLSDSDGEASSLEELMRQQGR